MADKTVRVGLENTSFVAVSPATSAAQTDGTQKTQIVDSGGEVATITGGRLDVNAGATSAATAVLSNVNDTNVSATLLASNANRLGATIWNDSTAVLYVKFGTTASATDCVVKLIADGYYEVPFGYTGRIDGVWASDASGAARITELTA